MRIWKSFIIGIEWLSAKLGVLGFLLVFFIAAIMNYEIVMRYLFTKPSEFSFEAAIQAQAFLAFLGLSYGLKEERHIHIEMLLEHLAKRTVNWLYAVTSLLSGIICGLVAYFGWGMVNQALATGEKSQTFGIPMFPMKFAFVIGFSSFSLQFFVRSYKYYQSVKFKDTKKEKNND